MTIQDNGNRQRITPERLGELLQVAQEAPRDSEGRVSASALLVELTQCLNTMLDLLQTTVSCIRPTFTQALPSVATTLCGIVQATETAALKVLDETEGLGVDRDRLSEALARLEPFLSASDSAARHAWEEAMHSSRALSDRIMSIMSAMEFQDLTAQRLAATIKSVEEIRERLLQILSLFYLPFEPDEPTRAKVPETQAEVSASERQALADQLLAEMADQGPQPSR